jgi:hypothetical protein
MQYQTNSLQKLHLNKMATEQPKPKGTATMEINGRPFYIKSDERCIPHLYDIDTNEDVGYWCQKNGTYVMFSPYEQIMNRLKHLNEEDLKNAKSNNTTTGETGETRETGETGETRETGETGETGETEETKETEDEVDSSVEDDDSDGDSDDSDSSVDEAKILKNLWSTNVFIKFIILMLIYNLFQQMVQSIYVDFAFAFTLTILYTRMVHIVSSEL